MLHISLLLLVLVLLLEIQFIFPLPSCDVCFPDYEVVHFKQQHCYMPQKVKQIIDTVK